MITLSIDATKIEEARIKPFNRRDGTTGQSVELVIFETKAGKWLVKQSCSKEERAAGVEMPILGEAKDWSKQSSPAASQAAKRANPASENVTEKDDVPF